MAAQSVLRRHGLARSLLQLRLMSSAPAAQQQLGPAGGEAGEPAKKMNLCSAINDALHIAMSTEKR